MMALLERNDVNPNTVNEHGQTPLLIAARTGHERVVQALLDRVDVNSDIVDLAGQTALSQALRRGYDGIVELLSEHRSSIPSLDGDGFATPSAPELSDLDYRPSKRIRRF